MPLKNPDLLQQIPLFQHLDQQERETLAKELDETRFLAGQIIFKMGDPGDKMYLVEAGQVELYLQDKSDQRVQIGFAEPGEMFGELALLGQEPRSASAKALKDTHLIIIDQHDLMTLFTSHPAAALDLMLSLSRRLRASNQLVRERVIRNPNDEIAKTMSFGERISDFLTAIAGDIRFVYFSLVWFFSWIVINMGLIPGIPAFDPFPFGLLTMVVSLEAIFLSLFVLISQNRQMERDKVRNDIEYEVNLRAGAEIRILMKQIEEMQQLMLNNFSRINTD